MEKLIITLRDRITTDELRLFFDIYDTALSETWLIFLNHLLKNNIDLEKNYCFLGFADSKRDGKYLCEQINIAINAINEYGPHWIKHGLDPYPIDDSFACNNVMTRGKIGAGEPGCKLIRDKTNMLHRWFEQLQGVEGDMSPYFTKASSEVKWQIRQLNLLCHELESWVSSYRKANYLPEWERPSQLMCWLRAPRFRLYEEHYEEFGLDKLAKDFGGVYMGVNKAIGKHHYEVWRDEKPEDIENLVTTTMRSQTSGAGDFDIDWGAPTAETPWHSKSVIDFKEWLEKSGFDPEDKKLTIGHPKMGQINLSKTFGEECDMQKIRQKLNRYSDVYKVQTSDNEAVYDYYWNDEDQKERQIKALYDD